MSKIVLRSRSTSNPLVTIRKAKHLVDEKTGIIRVLYETPADPDSPQIFGYGTLLADTAQYGIAHSSPVNGSTSIIRERAIAGAIGEAVERYSAAIAPVDELVYASYKEMHGLALDPRTLILYSEQQYSQPEFAFLPFQAEIPLQWKSGYSLTQEATTFVPAFAVYIPYKRSGDEPPFVQLISTGLACGNSLEEAILSGICEVVERDATMCMWLQGLSLPRLNCSIGGNSLVQETLARFKRSKYDVHLIDVTTDVSIPVVVAVAEKRMGNGPAAVFASNANLNPQQAVVGALDELAQCIVWVKSLMKKHGAESLPTLDQISSMEDHVLWASRKDRLEYVNFVFASTEQRNLQDIPNEATEDIQQNIQMCVAKLAEIGLEVIVVDITPPDIREIDLHVVRVIIPGTQPLYFGNGLERISSRILNDNYRQSMKRPQTTFAPHPFP